ncbi:hypothetical protein GLOIN_2v1488788 [Rhizophagus irregularis DAOM 181602=DAOM 197198]|nr:hypothetical protein GLOIN_2v1488788 [Rhizophagus irregularis DAOM 181602=DAOM 197198]
MYHLVMNHPPPPPPPLLLLLPFLKKEVFIWSDSELKDVYISNSDLLKMLYGRWRSRHRVKKKRRTNAANYLIQNKDKRSSHKKNSIYIYERWWRSPALQRLLHNRIDPTVELLKKKPPNLKCKRVLDKTETVSVPPAGAPSWCLNREALEKFNRLTKNIPVYDYDTDESIIQDNNGADDDVDNNVVNNKNNNKRKKRKINLNQKIKNQKNKFYNYYTFA